jgi:hypothetical protein
MREFPFNSEGNSSIFPDFISLASQKSCDGMKGLKTYSVVFEVIWSDLDGQSKIAKSTHKNIQHNNRDARIEEQHRIHWCDARLRDSIQPGSASNLNSTG